MISFRRGTSSGFSIALTAIVAGIWLALFGYLLWDRYAPHASELVDSIQFKAAEADDWFLIRIGGAYAGFGRSRQFHSGANWKLRDDLRVSLNIQGQVKPIRVVSESEVNAKFRLISFHLKISSGLISFEQKGRMEGRDLVLQIPRQLGGGVKRLTVRRAPRISRSLGLPLPLTGLKVGQKIKIPIFDPMDGHKTDAVVDVLERSDIVVAGKKQSSWRVRASYRSADLVMWIDDEGRLLKGRLPLGITVVRSDRTEIASMMHGTRALPELVSLTSVPVEGSVPDDPGLQLLRLKVGGVQEWDIPTDGFRQKFVNSQITITRERLPEASYTLPCKDPKMAEYLTASRFIRSDHPKIIEKAREIVGNESDPVKAAKLITTWVHDNLRKVPTPAVPDALTVLLSRRGDCNEHAVLAAALARAVGLPAQIAVGLVYAGDGFYYHAWVAYWAGSKWFSGDPLMNQVPASITHVTLLYGHVNVVSFLGRLRLKVLEARSGRSGRTGALRKTWPSRTGVRAAAAVPK